MKEVGAQYLISIHSCLKEYDVLARELLPSLNINTLRVKCYFGMVSE